MRNNRLVVLVIALAVAILGTLVVGVVAANATTTISQKISNHADDCSGGSHWANVTFTRNTMISRDVDAPGPNDVYKLTTVDNGTFKSIKGAKSLLNSSVTLSRSLTGSFTGKRTYTVTGKLRSASDLATLPDYNDNNVQGNHCSGDWWKQFFKSGATGSGNNDWRWTYATADETMVNGATGNSGLITGKLSSKVVVAGICRTNKTSKWKVSNIQGDRARSFNYWVWVSPGKWTKVAHGSVSAGHSVTLTTPRASSVALHYWSGYGKALAAHAKTSTHGC